MGSVEKVLKFGHFAVDFRKSPVRYRSRENFTQITLLSFFAKHEVMTIFLTLVTELKLTTKERRRCYVFFSSTI
jgi:hypothetical protein